MKVLIVGNGILGLTSAYRLIRRDRTVQIALIGPHDHRGCASLAAAAMFNSFCELEKGTLANETKRQKFELNRSATAHWPSLLQEIEQEANTKLEYGFGTFLVNNHASDQFEDENFDAVVAGLNAYNEPYESVKPTLIPHYAPAPRSRVSRAIYLPKEGWVNPVLLLAALQKILVASGRVQFIDSYCQSLHSSGDRNRIEHVFLANREKLTGDCILLTPGAAFSRIIEQSNLGLDMPRVFYGVGGTVLLETGDKTLSNCIRTPNRGLACGVYAAPHDASHTLVGTSNFISPVPEDHVRLSSIYTLLRAYEQQINLNFYQAKVAKVNVGWRPTSADTLPLLGKTSFGNLFVATGTKRDGLHCSPVISHFLADLILEGHSPLDLSLFAPERKLARIYRRDEAIELAVRHAINAAYQHGFEPSNCRLEKNLREFHTQDLTRLHDSVGAIDWGIPPELIELYRCGHIT